MNKHAYNVLLSITYIMMSVLNFAQLDIMAMEIFVINALIIVQRIAFFKISKSCANVKMIHIYLTFRLNNATFNLMKNAK